MIPSLGSNGACKGMLIQDFGVAKREHDYQSLEYVAYSCSRHCESKDVVE